MENVTLNTIVKSLIENNYLTENTRFQINLNSKQYHACAKTLYTEKQKSWILEVPVNDVFIFYKSDLVKRPLISPYSKEIRYLISYDYIKNNVLTQLKQIKTRYVIQIVCDNLPRLYVKSFLYKLNYFKPALYHVLMQYGNTVINKYNYSKCINYIKNNRKEIIKIFHFDVEFYEKDEHFILEQMFSSITKFDIRLRKTNEPDDNYSYIIEKNSMSN